jgi:hypothetical protein
MLELKFPDVLVQGQTLQRITLGFRESTQHFTDLVGRPGLDPGTLGLKGTFR